MEKVNTTSPLNYANRTLTKKYNESFFGIRNQELVYYIKTTKEWPIKVIYINPELPLEIVEDIKKMFYTDL